MNALVMYDHQSDTLWSQFLSRGVKGPLAKRDLEIVPAVQTNWDSWRGLHPDTLVLDKRGRYQYDNYGGYYGSGAAGIIGESNRGRRLPGKDLVLGLAVSGLAQGLSLRGHLRATGAKRPGARGHVRPNLRKRRRL